ncbi:MAG: 2Fe-2S iron-sulfur cluster binding domain-containing protein [Proteobacteria bacterium]|nr:2Fe-2S iron-sulfur cluster binding domain-containing protein [Pseudomonadota bacterium]
MVPPRPPPRFHRLRIAAVRRETADSICIGFDIPAALRAAYRFTPGQFLTLRSDRDGAELRRPYSICSTPDAALVWIGIKIQPGGRFSGWAGTALGVGDTIDVMTPDGRFGIPIEPGSNRTLLAIAAGSGITPVLSILGAALAAERGRCVLWYGNRARADIMFRSEIEDLKDRYLDRFVVVHRLSRERQEPVATGGRLDAPEVDRLLRALAPIRPAHAFLCGPAGLLDALPPVLQRHGLTAAQIHTERFTPAADAPPAPPCPTAGTPAAETRAAETPAAIGTVTFEGVQTTFPIAPEETVLAAGLRAGLALPYACRGGMCCTCRARLLQGQVRMAANYSLEPWETAAGYVLTCQAHPVSAHLVLDYDQV